MNALFIFKNEFIFSYVKYIDIFTGGVSMKNFFETFTTAVLLCTIIFATVSLMVTQMQLVSARETHSKLLYAVQESDEDSINDIYGLREQLQNSVRTVNKDWTVDIKRLESSNSRDYYLVTLQYSINVPLFGNVARGKIEGYAR